MTPTVEELARRAREVVVLSNPSLGWGWDDVERAVALAVRAVLKASAELGPSAESRPPGMRILAAAMKDLERGAGKKGESNG